ncbi:hypothetical protein AGMMS50218_08710 [Actinomycetota bacterium]|nr:hypothetical protein AGMMS50218_08710 [Actinomycetota bacterium]
MSDQDRPEQSPAPAGPPSWQAPAPLPYPPAPAAAAAGPEGAYPPPGQAPPGLGGPGYGQPGYLPPAGPPVAQRPNPFAGIPVSDYVVDGLAALLLLVSLALPWNALERATGRLEVVLVTILSVFSLALHYLARVGVFPASWTVRSTRLTRALLNVPYALLVATYVVLDLVAVLSDGRYTGSATVGGLGAAVGLGLAGAALAAAPRRAELGPEQLDRTVPVVWLWVTAGVGALAVVLELVSFVNFLTTGDLGYYPGWYIASRVVELVLWVAVVAWMVASVLARRASWRPVVLTAGTVAALVLLFLESSRTDYYTDVRSVGYAGVSLVLLPALGALAAGPALARAMRPQHPYATWAETAQHAWEYVVLLGVLNAAAAVTLLVGGSDAGADGATFVVLLVLSLLCVVAAVIARTSARTNPTNGRVISLVATGVVALLGLVTVIVAGVSDLAVVTYAELLLAFGLPALAVYALLVPSAVREYYAAHAVKKAPQVPAGYAGEFAAPATGQPWGGGAPAPAWPAAAPVAPAPAGPAPVAPPRAPVAPPTPPVAPPAPPAPPSHGFTAAQASDPATDLAVLASIAELAPELRPYVAANPVAYPGLLSWLADLHDPAVDQALRSRGH